VDVERIDVEITGTNRCPTRKYRMSRGETSQSSDEKTPDEQIPDEWMRLAPPKIF
jgi:hypothetical protein